MAAPGPAIATATAPPAVPAPAGSLPPDAREWLQFVHRSQPLQPELADAPQEEDARGCMLRIDRLEGILIPSSVLRPAGSPAPAAAGAAEAVPATPQAEATVLLGVRVSVFDEINRVFLGRTWASPMEPASLAACATGQLASATLGIEAFFHTTIADPACFGVAEVVAEVAVPGRPVRLMAAGWCALPLFTPSALGAGPVTSVLLAGTPRALHFIEGPVAQCQLPTLVRRPEPNPHQQKKEKKRKRKKECNTVKERTAEHIRPLFSLLFSPFW
jgi:hypothetical protein